MKRTLVDWSAASRARAGEKESGDRCVVKVQADGALLAVADGLGHGAEAALAADLAVRTVERYATEPLTENETWTRYEPGQWSLWRRGECVSQGQTS